MRRLPAGRFRRALMFREKEYTPMPNPAIARIAPEALPPHLQQARRRSRERTGDSTFIEVMANAPAVLDWYMADFYGRLFYNQMPGTTLDIRTKELLRIRLSKQHGCRFCNQSNTIDALAAGITQAQIDAMRTPSPALFDAKDLAVIDLASEMELSNMSGQLTRALYERLRAFYSDAQICEMGVVAAVLTGMAKMIFVYDLVEREEYCPIGPAEAAL
jgi:AhpD family alkylhydroperoxidase